MDHTGAGKGSWDGPLSARQLVAIIVVLGVIVAAIVFVPKVVRSAERAQASRDRGVQQLNQAICTAPGGAPILTGWCAQVWAQR